MNLGLPLFLSLLFLSGCPSLFPHLSHTHTHYHYQSSFVRPEGFYSFKQSYSTLDETLIRTIKNRMEAYSTHYVEMQFSVLLKQ